MTRKTTSEGPPAYDEDSSAAYIASRPVPTGLPAKAPVTTHKLQLEEDGNVKSSAVHFPQPSNLWMSRDVDHEDWIAFISQLSSSGPPTKINNTSQTPEQDGSGDYKGAGSAVAQRDNIIRVASQWNRNFFGPRGFKVLPVFGNGQSEEYETAVGTAAAAEEQAGSRGFGLPLGKNMKLGVSLPPDSNGFGLRLGGVLIGVNTGREK